MGLQAARVLLYDRKLEYIFVSLSQKGESRICNRRGRAEKQTSSDLISRRRNMTHSPQTSKFFRLVNKLRHLFANRSFFGKYVVSEDIWVGAEKPRAMGC